jgi:hypothetical protein
MSHTFASLDYFFLNVHVDFATIRNLEFILMKSILDSVITRRSFIMQSVTKVVFSLRNAEI